MDPVTGVKEIHVFSCSKTDSSISIDYNQRKIMQAAVNILLPGDIAVTKGITQCSYGVKSLIEDAF